VLADADKNFFNKIIMGDESCCFAYDPKINNSVLNELVRLSLGQRN